MASVKYKRISSYLLPAVVWFSATPIARAAVQNEPAPHSGPFDNFFADPSSGKSSFFDVYKNGMTSGGLITLILNFLITAASAIALVYLIYNGIQLITSAGDEAKMEQSKKGLTWTIIGIVAIVLTMFLIYATQNAVRE